MSKFDDTKFMCKIYYTRLMKNLVKPFNNENLAIESLIDFVGLLTSDSECYRGESIIISV